MSRTLSLPVHCAALLAGHKGSGDKTSITTVSCKKTFYTYPIRWDMSVEESIYTEKKARSLATLKDNSRFANKPCHKHLGSIHHPLLDIDLTKVVVDELHQLLRVTDLLTQNLITIAATMKSNSVWENPATTLANWSKLSKSVK